MVVKFLLNKIQNTDCSCCIKELCMAYTDLFCMCVCVRVREREREREREEGKRRRMLTFWVALYIFKVRSLVFQNFDLMLSDYFSLLNP